MDKINMLTTAPFGGILMPVVEGRECITYSKRKHQCGKWLLLPRLVKYIRTTRNNLTNNKVVIKSYGAKNKTYTDGRRLIDIEQLKKLKVVLQEVITEITSTLNLTTLHGKSEFLCTLISEDEVTNLNLFSMYIDYLVYRTHYDDKVKRSITNYNTIALPDNLMSLYRLPSNTYRKRLILRYKCDLIKEDLAIINDIFQDIKRLRGGL